MSDPIYSEIIPRAYEYGALVFVLVINIVSLVAFLGMILRFVLKTMIEAIKNVNAVIQEFKSVLQETRAEIKEIRDEIKRINNR